jgi:hypothetical protein
VLPGRCVASLVRGISVAAFGLLVPGAAAVAATGPGESPEEPLKFELSFPAGVRQEPADGRLFVVISREG